MARRKLSEQHIRKLTRSGSGRGSLGITVPISIIRTLGWRERQKVVVRRVGRKVIIQDWPAK